MSLIKIFNRISEDERKALNIINQAKFLALDLASQSAYSYIYNKYLNSQDTDLSNEDRLIISGYSIPYPVASTIEAKKRSHTCNS